jgi:hypothetical protein
MGIDDEELSVLVVEETVAYELMVVMVKERLMEIVKDKEPGEEEPRVPPERIGNPAVQVVIIWRRRVVGDNRRSLTIVVVFHDPRLDVFRTGRRWCRCRVFPFHFGSNGKTRLGREGFNRS